MWLFYVPLALKINSTFCPHSVFVCLVRISEQSAIISLYSIDWLFISVFNQFDAQNLFYNKFYFVPLHVSSTYAHHQEVKIALHSLWYHHTYRWPSRVLCVDDRLVCRSICSCIPDGHLHRVHETATYRCDDNRGCVIQFWPPDDKDMCSKHVEAWNKLIVKQFCASSWLITEIKIQETYTYRNYGGFLAHIHLIIITKL